MTLLIFGRWMRRTEKGLAETRERFSRKDQSSRSGTKSKTRLAIAFFGSAAGEKVSEPVIIWRSAKPR